MMQNPWNLLHTQFFTIHPSDDALVNQYNKKAKTDVQIHRSLPPLPFIGNPLTARVLLLGKNPTYSEKDEEDADRLPSLEVENHKALTFESKFPFFYLDPEFETTSGYQWWSNTLNEVLRACAERGLAPETTLSRIACVQWHPYRSKSSFDPLPLFPTQAYNYYLVGRAAAESEGRLFVMQYGMANERNWRTQVPNLPADVLRLKSAQNAKLSAGNLRAGDFDRLIETLCAPDPADAGAVTSE